MKSKKIENKLLKALFVSLFTAGCFLSANYCMAQGVGINTTGATADSSALLDVSSATKGTLITRMTTAQRDAIATPAQSLWIYNTTTKCFEFYDLGLWQTFYCATCPTPALPSVITGTTSLCQSASNNGIAYSVTAVTGGPPLTYSWTYSGTGYTCATGCTTNSITADFSGSATSGTLTCTPSNVCGTGTARTLAITINTNPTTAAAGSDQLNVTGGTTVTLAGNTPSSGTGAWSIASGTGGNVTTPSSPASTFTGTASTTYVLVWTISSAPCTASTDSVTISFGAAPYCSAGTSMGGGKAFYYDAGSNKCYVAATTDQSTSKTWGCNGTDITGAYGTAIGTGQANSNAILGNACATTAIAAYMCDTLTLGGYTDWFLPSIGELNQVYNQRAALGNFTVNYYVSSSESAALFPTVYFLAWDFFYGAQVSTQKTNGNYVRCIRSF